MKEINGYHAIAFIFIGLYIGGLLGICLYTWSDTNVLDDCINTMFSTCKYSNNLTDIVNLQSEIISQYNGGNFTILDKLNCNLLK